MGLAVSRFGLAMVSVCVVITDAGLESFDRGLDVGSWSALQGALITDAEANTLSVGVEDATSNALPLRPCRFTKGLPQRPGAKCEEAGERAREADAEYGRGDEGSSEADASSTRPQYIDVFTDMLICSDLAFGDVICDRLDDRRIFQALALEPLGVTTGSLLHALFQEWYMTNIASTLNVLFQNAWRITLRASSN